MVLDKKDFQNSQSSLWKAWCFIWINLKAFHSKILFAKFGWNQSYVSGRSWKCEELKDGYLYKKWSEKTFSSDELIKNPQEYIVEKGERLRVPNDTGVISCRAFSRQPYKLITQQNN